MADQNLNFLTGFPGGITMVRSSVAWDWNSSGTLVQFSANAPRISYDPITLACRGLRVERDATQYVVNSSCTGAIVPTDLPTGWEQWHIDGLTHQVVATGTEDGIPYVDVRVYGTPADGSGFAWCPMGYDIATGAAVGELWTGSIYMKLVAGSLSGFWGPRLNLSYYDSSDNKVDKDSGDFFDPESTGSLRTHRYEITRTVSGTGATKVEFWFETNHGTDPIDVTLRIGCPQLERSPRATSPMLTTNATFTRAQERPSLTIDANYWNATSNIVFCQFSNDVYVDSFWNAGTFRVFSLNDGDGTDLVALEYNNLALRSATRYGSGTTLNKALGTLSEAAQRMSLRAALKLANNSYYFKSSLAAGISDTTQTMPGPSQLQIGYSNVSGTYDQFFDGFIEQLVFIPGGNTAAQVDGLITNGYIAPTTGSCALTQPASTVNGAGTVTSIIQGTANITQPASTVTATGGLVNPGIIPADSLQPSASNPVFLYEISPADGSTTLPHYVPFTLGTYTLGTLPYDSATSGTVNFFFSDADWTERQRSSPGAAAPSTRENIHFEGRCSPPALDRTLPLTPEAGVRSVLSVGDISLNNSDGYFDSLIQTYAIDGRKINIRLLKSPADSYTSSISVFNGVGVDWVAIKDTMTLRVRERSYNLDVPLLTLFGGTGGADGTSANQGHPVPQAYGICRNITAELIDSAKLIYRFHDRTASAVLAVYDRGAPITAGSSYADYTALSNATTAAGHYDWCLSSNGSFFRLGSSPSGSITADVRGDAEGGYVGTAGSIIKRLMLRGSLLSDLNSGSLTVIDTNMPGEIGCYFNSQTNISAAIDQICTGTFTFWGDIGDGLLGVYQLTDPALSTPTYEVNEYSILGELEPVNLPDNFGPTVWRRRVAYQLNWTPMSGTDIVPAPTITEARRKQLQDPNRLASIGISNRQVKNLLAVDAPTLVSMFDNYSDGAALAQTLLDLYSPGRGLWNVPVGLFGYQIRLNDVIFLKWPRFGLNNGRNVRVVGLSYDGPKVTLTVFG